MRVGGEIVDDPERVTLEEEDGKRENSEERKRNQDSRAAAAVEWCSLFDGGQ